MAVTRGIAVFALSSAVFLASVAMGASPQLPLTSQKSTGNTVTPAFEGWYQNPDGSYTMSFGYYNRNASEVVEVPVGAQNFVSPGPQNQGQPSEFQPDRHWGVFGVRLPANTRKDAEVTWTISFRGATYAIPGNLKPNWKIDALEGEAGSGNTPPVVKFAQAGPEGRGPMGVTAGPLTAQAGTALAINAWVSDDGKGASSIAGARGTAASVTLAWFKHQGPGAVTFQPATGRAASAGAQVTTQATFAKPGDYIIRLRANDSTVAGAGHAQCCWTNGFLKVTVK